MLRRSSKFLFYSQHRTPILPQCAVDGSLVPQPISVAYFLCREPVVKHDPHPVEQEMGFLLEREHARYSRHSSYNSSTDFFASRNLPLDNWNRTDSKVVANNFFNLQIYHEATKIMVAKYSPSPRLQPDDFITPLDPSWHQSTAPKRHTLKRMYNDYLFLLVYYKGIGKWGLPMGLRQEDHSLRTALDSTVFEQHPDVEHYVRSNAPQAVLPGLQEDGGKKDEMNPLHSEKIFVFYSTYVAGKPSFDKIKPEVSDHAWVTRRELLSDYASTIFVHPKWKEVLVDISPDSLFEAH